MRRTRLLMKTQHWHKERVLSSPEFPQGWRITCTGMFIKFFLAVLYDACQRSWFYYY